MSRSNVVAYRADAKPRRRRRKASGARVVTMPRVFSFLREAARYKCAYGGRGGGKSWAVARQLLLRGLMRRELVLCARELQVSIADSVHRLLCDQIDALGLGGFYTITKTAITGANGTEFIFCGLRSNVNQIKSLEGVTIAWIEEAETVSEASWRVLIPTIRADGSEIWVTFNPREETDPTYRRFVTNPPPDSRVVKVNWSDNPYFPAELRKEMVYDYATDPEAAAHVWGGECRRKSAAQILAGHYVIEPFAADPAWCGPYYGADWGFAQDPTALVMLWIDPAERILYVEHEAYKVGCEIDETPALFDEVPGARTHTIRADCARPETISAVRRAGYPLIEAAEKWAGSVEDGIAFLLGFRRIVVHPRCKHFADEARLYSHKTDPLTGDVLRAIVDKHNHLMDATRYALAPMIRDATPGFAAYAEQQLAAAARDDADGAAHDDADPWALAALEVRNG